MGRHGSAKRATDPVGVKREQQEREAFQGELSGINPIAKATLQKKSQEYAISGNFSPCTLMPTFSESDACFGFGRIWTRTFYGQSYVAANSNKNAHYEQLGHVLLRWKVISGLEQRPAGFFDATAKGRGGTGRGGRRKMKVEQCSGQPFRGGAGWRFVAIMRHFHFQPNYGNDVRKCAVSERPGKAAGGGITIWSLHQIVDGPRRFSAWK